MEFLDQMTREERVQAALDEAEQQLDPNLTKTAAKWDIGRHTLRRRLNGVGPRESRTGPGKKLTEEQEQAIINYCSCLDKIDASARLTHVTGAANLLIARTHTDPTCTPEYVSEKWTQRFINRHQELYMIKQKPLDLLRHTTRARRNQGVF